VHLLHHAQYAFERRLPRCDWPDARCGFEPRGQRERARRESQQQCRSAARKPTAHDESADPRHRSPQHERCVAAHPAAIGERDARDLAGGDGRQQVAQETEPRGPGDDSLAPGRPIARDISGRKYPLPGAWRHCSPPRPHPERPHPGGGVV
jgi:hypothetical protein